jgi:hypothetical protein
MKLSQLVAKPQLIKVTIEDEDIVKEFGETIEFWTYDRQPMDTFMKLASMDGSNYGEIVKAVRNLVLDEEAKPILKENEMPPTKVLIRVVSKVLEGLGK